MSEENEVIEFDPQTNEKQTVIDKKSSNHYDPRHCDCKYQGYHIFQVRTERFLIDARYQPLRNVGQGAYGVVCSCTDMLRRQNYAIKKVPKAFDDEIDAKRVLREIKLMRHFDHPNIVTLIDMIPPLESEAFNDIYAVMDLMETDLHRVIYSKNELSIDHVRFFVYQLLKGLQYVHSANVLHRDIKPSNLLVNGNCQLKICDFGLARGVEGGENFALTEYVITRWYRAPEVMLSCESYDEKVDIWSAGCIMAELFGRTPIFPGIDQIDQMQKIFDQLGTPSAAETADFVTDKFALDFINSAEKRTRKPLGDRYKTASPAALDLMEGLLQFNPHRRLTVEQALAHPFFRKLNKMSAKDPERERKRQTCHAKFNFAFEELTLTRPVLRELMWEEVVHYRPYLKGRPMPIDPEENLPSMFSAEETEEEEGKEAPPVA